MIWITILKQTGHFLSSQFRGVSFSSEPDISTTCVFAALWPVCGCTTSPFSLLVWVAISWNSLTSQDFSRLPCKILLKRAYNTGFTELLMKTSAPELKTTLCGTHSYSVPAHINNVADIVRQPAHWEGYHHSVHKNYRFLFEVETHLPELGSY